MSVFGVKQVSDEYFCTLTLVMGRSQSYKQIGGILKRIFLDVRAKDILE